MFKAALRLHINHKLKVRDVKQIIIDHKRDIAVVSTLMLNVYNIYLHKSKSSLDDLVNTTKNNISDSLP